MQSTEEERIKVSLVSKLDITRKLPWKREVTKLHYCDSTSSNNEFSSYAQSIKLISTKSTTHSVNNETLDLCFEGTTLSKFIHEGKTDNHETDFVALPSFTSHSTFYECSRSILCKPQDSPHSPLTRMGAIISYSLRLERKITLPSIQESFCPMFTLSQVTNQYGVYTASPAKKNSISNQCSQEQQESSISSQSVEYCSRYKHQSAA